MEKGQQATEARIAAVGDVAEGAPFCANLGGKEIAVFKVGEGYRAIDNLCTHRGGPLCQGGVAGGVVTCPWHGSRFKIETGEVIEGPAKTGVAAYDVEARDGQLYVRLGAPTAVGAAAPKPVTPVFQPELDKDKPFTYEPFAKELLRAIAFPFKLYGVLPSVVIAHDADEVDVHLGEIHITEVDLLKLSSVMSSLNAKWGTAITYCLFHTSRFPGVMLLNIRGPKAPTTLKSDIAY